MSTIDPIRILLIDDNPMGFPKARGYSDHIPVMGYDYRQHFDYRWVATPHEAREMRDLSWLIEQKDPSKLGRDGWVPELLALDYALTQYDENTVADRMGGVDDAIDTTSPLPALWDCAQELGIEPKEVDQFDLQPGAGSEYWGCFIGGLFLNSFATHPCAPVTITRYSQETLRSEGPDAAFFEWMMEVQSGGHLKASGDSEDAFQNWDYVIPAGVRKLRERIYQLAAQHIITVSIPDLQRLLKDPLHPSLAVESRYGIRRYPIQGLFIDHIEEEQRNAEIIKYAKSLLGLIIDQAVLQPAQDFAEQFWAAYTADESDDASEYGKLKKRRRRLSEIYPDQAQSELADLKKEFDVKKVRGDSEVCGVSLDLHQDVPRPLRRWVAILILYRHVVRAARIRLVLEKDLDSDKGPSLIPNDLWLSLFPLPYSPIQLPDGSKDANSYKDGRWAQDNGRVISLSVPMAVKGQSWIPDGPKANGLKDEERHVLRSMAIEETDLLNGKSLKHSIFWECETSRRILWKTD